MIDDLKEELRALTEKYAPTYVEQARLQNERARLLNGLNFMAGYAKGKFEDSEFFMETRTTILNTVRNLNIKLLDMYTALNPVNIEKGRLRVAIDRDKTESKQKKDGDIDALVLSEIARLWETDLTGAPNWHPLAAVRIPTSSRLRLKDLKKSIHRLTESGRIKKIKRKDRLGYRPV
jgi:hypothetical protein